MATGNLDGTSLGTGEIISNEYIDPAQGGRTDPDLPPAAYKLPRSKIAVGDFGIDGGDASYSNPLPVDSRGQRQQGEIDDLRNREEQMLNLQRFAYETFSMVDRRGRTFATRGVR